MFCVMPDTRTPVRLARQEISEPASGARISKSLRLFVIGGQSPPSSEKPQIFLNYACRRSKSSRGTDFSSGKAKTQGIFYIPEYFNTAWREIRPREPGSDTSCQAMVIIPLFRVFCKARAPLPPAGRKSGTLLPRSGAARRAAQGVPSAATGSCKTPPRRRK